MIFFFFTFGFAGLLVGSFLNVVIFRLERDESFVGGRSHCLACSHTLPWYDNIPLVSFLMLGGKCRYCQAALSKQYPLVELATASLFLVTAIIVSTYQPGFSQAALAVLLLVTVCFAVLITVYDLRFALIPTVFLWGINVSTALYLLFYKFLAEAPVGLFPPSVQSSLWGAFIAGSFFFLLVFLSRETWMGWGDVWLGVWGGMFLGIELVQIFITLSFTLGAIVGLTLVYQRTKTLKAEIPFAPYILVAGFVLFGMLLWTPEALQFLSPWLPGTIE